MLAAGLIIDEKFELIRQIGSGSYGDIFEARQLGLDRKVALKILKSDELDWETSERLLREASILSEIHHRNIVTVYGYGIWQGSPYIAMEYLQGRSLGDQLDEQKRLFAGTTVDLFLQICDALICAHAHGIVHRDLKPDNVFLATFEPNSPLVKVIDFGLAKTVATQDTRSAQQLTDLGLVVGTVSHMSPEQCQGLPADQRSDIYAIGCILYECLTGRLPYTGDSPLSIMMKHINEPSPRLQDVLGDTPAAHQLQYIVARCMEKNANDRYETVEALREDLVSFKKGLPLGPVVSSQPAKRESHSSLDSNQTSPSNRKAQAMKTSGMILAVLLLLLLPLGIRAFNDEHVAGTAAFVFNIYAALPDDLRDPRVEQWCLQSSSKGTDISARMRLLSSLWQYRRQHLQGKCEQLTDIGSALITLQMQVGNTAAAHLTCSLTCDDIARKYSFRLVPRDILEKMYELCMSTHNRSRASLIASRIATLYDDTKEVDNALTWYNRVFELTEVKLNAVFNRRIYRARIHCAWLYAQKQDMEQSCKQLLGACQQLSHAISIDKHDAELLGKTLKLFDRRVKVLPPEKREKIHEQLHSALSFVLETSMSDECRDLIEAQLPGDSGERLRSKE